MKFKKPSDYERAETAGLPEERAHTAVVLALRCVFCMEHADILHKGSSYCRKCYDDKNYVNALIA